MLLTIQLKLCLIITALVYRIPGDLTYLNAPSHTDRSKKIPERYKTIILSLRHLFYLDLDGLDALTDMVQVWEMEKRFVVKYLIS